MDWFSKLFKCSKHKRSADYEVDTDSTVPSSTSGDESSKSENESGDIEPAITLPLAEGNENANDSNSQQEHEHLPRAKEESYGNGNTYEPYLYQMYFPTDSRICAGCNTDIGDAQYLRCLNAFWHPLCFRCRGCNQPISDEFVSFRGLPYHKSCYHNYLLRCEVCYNIFPTNYDGLIEYRTHLFWTHRFCASHIYDSTPKCCSCERLEPQGTPYTDLSDGRKICLECMESAIMNSDQCQPLYHDIKEFFGIQNMELDQEIPIYMVERHALNQGGECERELNGHPCVIEIRGICLSESEVKGTSNGRGKGKGKEKTKRHCNVTAIHLLFGLPRLLTGSILAHEMMHAWLRIEGYEAMDQYVEEGICQAVAYLWLEAELSSGSSNNFAPASSLFAYDAPRTFGEFCKYLIESNMSPVYGGGFRAAMLAVLNYGLQMTLHHIKTTGSLPHVRN